MSAAVKLRASVLPRNSNSLAYSFGSPVREAAQPLQEALSRQLDADSPLRRASLLEAVVTLAFGDRRGRNPRNFEIVTREAISGALEDAGIQAELRRVDVRVLRDRRRRPSTTIELREVTL